jgi:hypothetical protein
MTVNLPAITKNALDQIPLVFDFRDFKIADPAKRFWQGEGLKNTDGVWTSEGDTLPLGTILLCVFASHVVQQIEKSGIIFAETIVELAGQPFPSDDEIYMSNDKIPKDRWREYNGKLDAFRKRSARSTRRR